MNTKKVDNPHDWVARKYFSNPGAMGNVLREFLSREMYEALDISSLEPTRESFIAPGLKESIAELSKEKLRANLTDNAMLLLLQALLLKYLVEQIARIFLLLDSAMNREFMDTIRMFLNYVQQTNSDITESRIKQSIDEIVMKECITTPMKPFEEYWFTEFDNKGKAEGITEGETRGLRSAVTSFLFSRFEEVDSILVRKIILTCYKY